MAGAMFSHGESQTSKTQACGSGAFLRVLNLLGARGLTGRMRRRLGWFAHNLTAGKAANMLAAATEFALKREKVCSWPVFLRIDISPLCNLNCTVCVHADPKGNAAL
jgi:hypothetical protein